MFLLSDWRAVVRSEEVVHVVHGPHDARGQRGPERDQRVPVSVQEQQVNKQKKTFYIRRRSRA